MDILTLLVILIGVVTLMWIVASYMEIEKLKTIVYGEKTKDEVIQPVGEVATPFDAFAQIWSKMAEQIEDSMLVLFHRKIPKMRKDKIYYLCHPCTTGERTIAENKEREEALFKRIIKENPGIRIIRPLQIIPEDMPHEEAMIRCFNMLDAADTLILPMGWEKSNGCSMEHKRAEKKGKERILLRTN